jgi:ATP-binding cassette subfamily F protein 3
LLKILLHPSNLLILDEPTNHLDISSKEVLLDALLNFPGTVLFVAHDKYFLKQLAAKVFEFKSNSLFEYPGDYNYYLWKTEESPRHDAEEEPAAGSAGREPVQKKSNEEQKIRRNRLQRLGREEEDIMQRLEEIEEEKKNCEHLLSKPEHYKDGASVKELSGTIEQLAAEKKHLDARWEALENERLQLEKEGTS